MSKYHRAIEDGNIDMVIEYLDNGGNVNILDDEDSDDPVTLLYMAICEGNLELSKRLIDMGIDLWVEEYSGDTVFDLCDQLLSTGNADKEEIDIFVYIYNYMWLTMEGMWKTKNLLW